MDLNLNFEMLMTIQGLSVAVAIIVYIITNYFKTSETISSRVLDLIKLFSAIIISYSAFYVTGNLNEPNSYLTAFINAVLSQWVATGAYEQLKNFIEKR